jgi:hypothetical protein
VRRWARGGKRREGFDLCNREQTKETDIRSPHGLSVSSVSGFTNYWNADVSPFHQRSALHHHYKYLHFLLVSWDNPSFHVSSALKFAFEFL